MRARFVTSPAAMLLVWLWLSQAATAQSPMPIRSIQLEAAEERFEEKPVAVRGVVTWTEKGGSFFVQDDSGGVRVVPRFAAPPSVGDRVSVKGRLARAAFAPVVEEAEYRTHGKSAPPEARRASGGGLLNGAFNGERVEVDGWVRDAEIVDGTLAIVLNSGSSRLLLRVGDPGDIRPEAIVPSHVRARGIASAVRARGQLRQLVEVQVLVPAAADLFFSQTSSVRPEELPVLAIDKATQYRPGQTRGDRMHVIGQVIHRQNGIAYLHDGTSGLAVRGKDVAKHAPGSWLHAVGFLDMEEFLPVLSESIFLRAAEARAPIEPSAVAAENLLDGLQHANFVRVRGRVLDRMTAPVAANGTDKLVLALQSPGGVFSAELEPLDGPLPAGLEPGAIVETEGVCLVQTDASGNPASFKILVPHAKHLRVAEPPGFFTVRRLLLLLTVTLAVLLALISAAWWLARRNAGLLAEMAERQAVAAERSRLARDLHDTLEQGLTGIHLQLHSIGPGTGEASAETQDRLRSIRSLVQQCHSEMRRSIWNLRPAQLETFDLAEALERSARSLVLGSGVTLDFEKSGTPALPPLIEDNLLRIGQEAVTNAVKHAAAHRITIELHATPAEIALAVSDDGRGMNLVPNAANHFGLDGMRERAARIGGRINFRARPGGGTRVEVLVPLAKPAVSHE